MHAAEHIQTQYVTKTCGGKSHLLSFCFSELATAFRRLFLSRNVRQNYYIFLKIYFEFIAFIYLFGEN